MRKKSFLPLIFVGLALLIVVAPVSARTVENGGTIYIGEEHVNMQFYNSSVANGYGLATNGFVFSNGQLITYPSKTIYLDNYADASFPASEFAGYTGRWQSVDLSENFVMTGSYFILATPAPTPTTPPTPTPTPSTGNMVISSSPSDATVYVDNVIKGITPLTISVANGEHVVRIRLDGYQESKTSVTVNGADVSIKPVLIPVVTTVATTVPTTITTTIQTTVPTTVPTTELTTVSTTTPTPTAKVNYSATIATMQSQIAEQNAKIEEQGSWIDQILRFLGLK